MRIPSISVLFGSAFLLALTTILSGMAYNNHRASFISDANPDDTLLATPVIDTYIASGKPTQTFATDRFLWAGYNVSEGLSIERSLIRFDLSSIKKGSRIDSATLHMYLYGTTQNDSPRIMRVCSTSDNWDSSATWQSHNSLSCIESPIPESVSSVLETDWSWTITALVDEWVNNLQKDNSKFSLLVRGDESAGNNERGFASTECNTGTCVGKAPRLEITFSEPTPAPTPPPTATPTPTPGFTSFTLRSEPIHALEAGEEVTYTISYQNGPLPLRNVVISNTVPISVALMTGTIHSEPAADWRAAYISETQTIYWRPQDNAGRLIGNATGILSYQARRPSATPLPTASPTPVHAPSDLLIVKSGPGSVSPSQLITYLITVTNRLETPVHKLVITDTIPTNATLYDAEDGTVTLPPQAYVTWSVPELAAGEDITKTLVVVFPPNITEVVNEAYGVQGMVDGEPIHDQGDFPIVTTVIQPEDEPPLIINQGAYVQWEFAEPGHPFVVGGLQTPFISNPLQVYLPVINK